jgi:NitT/TauT family transport system permease protein
MRPLQPVTPGAKVSLGIAFFIVFTGLWALATLGGFVSPTFLASPVTMVKDGWELLTVHGFALDIGVTIWRVVGGFLMAAVLAVPLGVLMGAYKPIEAFFEPFVSFARYLPASAFIPLLILWAGIGELQKLLVIFIGSFFQLVLMVAVAVGNTRRDLVEAAYTLGASEEIIFLPESDSNLDLSQIVYDYTCLSLPMQRIHEDGKCNPSTVKYLSSEDRSQSDDDSNPFSKLKELIKDKK